MKTNWSKKNASLIRQLTSFVLLFCLSISAFAINDLNYITTEDKPGSFPIFSSDIASLILLSDNEPEGVAIAARNLQTDIERVSTIKPTLIIGNKPTAAKVIIVGTIGKSKLINNLIDSKKIDATLIEGKWETFIITVVNNPMKGVEQALVIAGSDKRGTIFGIYDVCEKIGVSPWNWWADVPVVKQKSLYVLPGVYTLGEPKVKYRGIFINDEAPALTDWAFENYNGFNSKFYEHVFELILRLKGNYLWPAMWGRAIYDDDSLSPILADKMGVVIGTSHHEPMMRAHVEWSRYGKGPWNYEKNEEVLQNFWREGIERMGKNESLVTIGMRGDGDEAMAEGTVIPLLEKIVTDQRKIIEDVTGKPADKTPQVWALYKEVQDYYDRGMRVPDDVTLLLCDDNWGNVRVLPKKEDRNRSGGYGMYYHFDFVGGPRNYKWLNTMQIERVWEQMNLTYRYGVDRLWLVNVGDIKPMELPISFFLDFAWNPDSLTANMLPDYYKAWASQQFGGNYTGEIAEILARYTKFNSRRKPEMLSPETYSQLNYREAENVVLEYLELTDKSQKIYNKLPAEYKDAYYQLVQFPVEACANLNELYFCVARNQLYAQQKRVTTNAMAERVETLFYLDTLFAYKYHTLANGKWNHMMSQTHIGYTSWQQPDRNIMPQVQKIDAPDSASLGIVIENSNDWYPDKTENLSLPDFDPINNQNYYIEIFNRGLNPLEYTVKSNADWVVFSENHNKINTEKRIDVSIDWAKAPKGKNSALIEISGSDKSKVTINVPIENLNYSPVGFVENNGVVSIEASDFTKQISDENMYWEIIPNLGRTASSVAPMPVDATLSEINENSPRLEYEFFIFDTCTAAITTMFSPTLNFKKEAGLQYAISVDDQLPQLVNIHQNENVPDWRYPYWWNMAVSENIRKYTTTHKINTPGKHVIKFWAIDAGIVLQKIVLEYPNVQKYSYLGPPESKFIKE